MAPNKDLVSQVRQPAEGEVPHRKPTVDDVLKQLTVAAGGSRERRRLALIKARRIAKENGLGLKDDGTALLQRVSAGAPK